MKKIYFIILLMFVFCELFALNTLFLYKSGDFYLKEDLKKNLNVYSETDKKERVIELVKITDIRSLNSRDEKFYRFEIEYDGKKIKVRVNKTDEYSKFFKKGLKEIYFSSKKTELEQELAEHLKENLMYKIDKFDNEVSLYYYNSNYENFYMYLEIPLDDKKVTKKNLWFRRVYSSKSWLFIDRTVFKCGSVEITFYGESNRQVGSSGNIYETNHSWVIKERRDKFKKIFDFDERIMVRFYGSKYYDDTYLSDRVRIYLKKMLYLFDLLNQEKISVDELLHGEKN